jgi:hypothetical protein
MGTSKETDWGTRQRFRSWRTLRQGQLIAAAPVLLLSVLVLGFLNANYVSAQFGAPSNDVTELAGPERSVLLLDDTNQLQPCEPQPRTGRFQIVAAGTHILLLDSALGHTWLLQGGGPGKNEGPQWRFVPREILDDHLQAATPADPDRPAAASAPDNHEHRDEGNAADPFGPDAEPPAGDGSGRR